LVDDVRDFEAIPFAPYAQGSRFALPDDNGIARGAATSKISISMTPGLSWLKTGHRRNAPSAPWAAKSYPRI